MKVTKQQASLLQTAVTISQVPVGQPVYAVKAKRIIMKVKPTGCLLNSTIVADVSQRGGCLVCAPETGTVYAVEGSTEVQRISSELFWSEA